MYEFICTLIAVVFSSLITLINALTYHAAREQVLWPDAFDTIWALLTLIKVAACGSLIGNSWIRKDVHLTTWATSACMLCTMFESVRATLGSIYSANQAQSFIIFRVHHVAFSHLFSLASQHTLEIRTRKHIALLGTQVLALFVGFTLVLGAQLMEHGMISSIVLMTGCDLHRVMCTAVLCSLANGQLLLLAEICMLVLPCSCVLVGNSLALLCHRRVDQYLVSSMDHCLELY